MRRRQCAACTDCGPARAILDIVVVQFAVEVEDRPSKPTAPVGIDVGIKDRAILSTGKTVPAVRIDRRPLKRAQRVV